MFFSDDFSEQPTTLIPVETMREVVGERPIEDCDPCAGYSGDHTCEPEWDTCQYFYSEPDPAGFCGHPRPCPMHDSPPPDKDVVDRAHEDDEYYEMVDDADVVLTDLPDGKNFSDDFSDGSPTCPDLVVPQGVR